jgi:plasmid stability protein
VDWEGVTMPVTLSIKNVPDDLLERLRERAKKNHRSLQGELMALLEEGVRPRRPSLREVNEYAKSLGLRTPGDSVEIIRELRDGR